jgi:hypothetical protein
VAGAAGFAGVWALAMAEHAATNRIERRCFIVDFYSREIPFGVYQAR